MPRPSACQMTDAIEIFVEWMSKMNESGYHKIIGDELSILKSNEIKSIYIF